MFYARTLFSHDFHYSEKKIRLIKFYYYQGLFFTLSLNQNKIIMNTRTILGAVLGGLILWLCQFMSWGLLDLHYSEMQYTDKQESIMNAINAADLEEGDYFIPRAAKGDMEAMEALQTEAQGKPWAMVRYRSSLNNQMPMNLVRGLLIDIIAAWLLIWIFGKMDRPMMGTIVTTCIAIGIIGYLLISYLNSIWFDGNSIPDLIDAVVHMGLVGAFLGWWLNRD